MKDYARYMNRQRMSETGMARLVKLEAEGPEQGRKRKGNGKDGEGYVPQWVKYCAMAASLVLLVGVCALAVLQGGRGIGTDPIATAGPDQVTVNPVTTPTPAPVTGDELFFNEMDTMPIPLTDKAITNEMERIPMEMMDVAALFGCFLEDYGEVLENLGWGEFNMKYYRVDGNTDSTTGKNVFRFLAYGSYVSPIQDELKEFSNFWPGNDVWLEIYEGHSYAEEDTRKDLTACQFNGHTVVASCDGADDYHAEAAFDVVFAGKTYGVLYSVTTFGEQNAKELVTRLVERFTSYGVFPETSGESGVSLRYAELTEISPNRQVRELTASVGKELTAEEVKKVFPAAAEALDYHWRGDVEFNGDETIRYINIEGNQYDGSARVYLTIGAEEDVFLLNSEVKDGEVSYVGIENGRHDWADLMRGYYRYAPEYYWWWDGETSENALHVSCQGVTQAIDMVFELRTCMKEGTLEESIAFNELWVNRALDKGILLGSVVGTDGKIVLTLLTGEKPRGTYRMETADGSTGGNAPTVTITKGEITISSEAHNYHTCTGEVMWETENGKELLRTVCAKCNGIYSFEIVDENTLRFDMDHSTVVNHHSDWTSEVTDGAVFRQILYGEKTAYVLSLHSEP